MVNVDLRSTFLTLGKQKTSFRLLSLNRKVKLLNVKRGALSYAFPPSHLGHSSELDAARFGVGSQMRKPFVVLYRIADVTDGLTAASSAGQSGVDLRSSSFAPRQSPSELVTALGLASVERNVSLTASSLLTLGITQAWMALAAPSVDVCPHRAQCPVLDELAKSPTR